MGNRYEYLWVALRMSELLKGEASRIRVEPLGEAGRGVELEVDIAGVTWVEQVKRSADPWTIKKLTTDGVLANMKSQIVSGRWFRLVGTARSEALSTLADVAGKAESFSEFTEALGKGRCTDLSEVAKEWNVRPEEAWCFLQKVDVKRHLVDDLERIVRWRLGTLCEADPVVIFGVLREFCEERLHESFDAESVWSYLASKGLQPSSTNDKNAVEAFQRTLERQQRRVKPFEPRIGLVPRSDVESVLDKLQDPNGNQIVIVDGQAGSGKSTVVTQAAARLADQGWLVAVARMDTNASVLSSNRLGQEMGLTKSPTLLLAEVSRGASALLVVDQLDAVSLYSGRMPDNFESVAETITEAKHVGSVKVLLVVRTVDLDDDPRLRSLVSDGNVEKHSLKDLNIEDMKTHLRSHGMKIPTSQTTLELLCSPLHLDASMISKSGILGSGSCLAGLGGLGCWWWVFE